MTTRRAIALPTVTLALAVLLAGPAAAETKSDPAAAAAFAFDLVVVRPFGLVATAVGAVMFIPAAILTSPNGRDAIEEAFDVFVAAPGEYIYKRPLGEF